MFKDIAKKAIQMRRILWVSLFAVISLLVVCYTCINIVIRQFCQCLCVLYSSKDLRTTLSMFTARKSPSQRCLTNSLCLPINFL